MPGLRDGSSALWSAGCGHPPRRDPDVVVDQQTGDWWRKATAMGWPRPWPCWPIVRISRGLGAPPGNCGAGRGSPWGTTWTRSAHCSMPWWAAADEPHAIPVAADPWSRPQRHNNAGSGPGAHSRIIGLGEAARILATPKPARNIAGPASCAVPTGLSGVAPVVPSRRRVPSGALSSSGCACMTKQQCRTKSSGC